MFNCTFNSLIETTFRELRSLCHAPRVVAYERADRIYICHDISLAPFSGYEALPRYIVKVACEQKFLSGMAFSCTKSFAWCVSRVVKKKGMNGFAVSWETMIHY